MPSLQNILSCLLVAATAVSAVPTGEVERDVQDKDLMYPTIEYTDEVQPGNALVARKNANKCETHIHIDSSNGLCGNKCTEKWNVNIVDKGGNAIGKTWDWSKVGTWSATNFKYQVKIGTTKGKEFWIDGHPPSGFIKGDWHRSFTLHYDSQHWNGMQCPNVKYKSPRISNGHRHEFDLWCEFDC